MLEELNQQESQLWVSLEVCKDEQQVRPACQGGLGSSPAALQLPDRCKAATGLQASGEQTGDSFSRSLEATQFRGREWMLNGVGHLL